MLFFRHSRLPRCAHPGLPARHQTATSPEVTALPSRLLSARLTPPTTTASPAIDQVRDTASACYGMLTL